VDCGEYIARKAIDILVSHHDMLRGVLTDNGIEVIPSDERKAYQFNSISINDKEEATEYLKNTRLEDDNLVKVVFCKTEKTNLVCFTIHHFLIDLVSWEVLIKDFNTVTKQLMNNEKISLPAKTASFKLWNLELNKYSEITENKEYWNSINEKLQNTATLFVNEENEAEEYSVTLDENTSSKLINDVNSKYGTRTNEVLLTAVGLAAAKLAKGTVSIAVESHGRAEIHKPIAIERTVGWFTSCYPVVVNNNNDVAEELINTKDTMRRIPRNGVEYLLLNDGFHENTDIIFNFFKTSLAEEKREKQTVVFGGNSVFPGMINVNCSEIDNILTVGISVPKCNHKANISEELGLEIKKQVEKIVEICTETKEVIKTRSDFSDDELTENELDELIDLFDWGEDDEE
jgi:non-ribosomal peptide synthase protein (TIGR01720 family)